MGTSGLVFVALAALAVSGTIDEFAAWAWARHHNVLSWYIRPLFLLPFCYFAYRRSLWGIVLTLLALATSMFWFPAPERVDPRAADFLAVEREYLTGGWSLWKVLLALLVPVGFAALAGLVVCDAVILYVLHRMHKGSSPEPPRGASPHGG